MLFILRADDTFVIKMRLMKWHLVLFCQLAVAIDHWLSSFPLVQHRSIEVSVGQGDYLDILFLKELRICHLLQLRFELFKKIPGGFILGKLSSNRF